MWHHSIETEHHRELVAALVKSFNDLPRRQRGALPIAETAEMLGSVPLDQRLRLLREAAGLSRSRLSRQSVSYNGEGVSEETIKALEAGKWSPSAQTLEAIAHGLRLPPSAFPEHRLAVARRLFDEREIGLGAASANLAELLAAIPDAFEGGRRQLAEADEPLVRHSPEERADARELLAQFAAEADALAADLRAGSEGRPPVDGTTRGREGGQRARPARGGS